MPSSSCPFAGAHTNTGNKTIADIKAKRQRVITLYENYVHLPALQKIWHQPVTQRPDMEPCFCAAMHGIEICLLIMTQTLEDARDYVAKRPRFEMLADDIIKQCFLLAEIVDGELEEHPSSVPRKAGTLTQEFPFEGCPPTTQQAGHSPSLDMLIKATRNRFSDMCPAERVSLSKVVRNISNAFESNFRDWTVGIGLEPQLNSWRECVGLSRIASFECTGKRVLDYQLLVRPEFVLATYTEESYQHVEDFFFRSIHLGTECWAHIAIRRLESARELAEEGEFHNAAARTRQAAHILSYLGNHVFILTQLVLRDYLHLKVQIEGTSGEGSLQVKAFRPLIRSLLAPLKTAVLSEQDCRGEDEAVNEKLKGSLLVVYDRPEDFPGLYVYAKALEQVESALLGGFYFAHFQLASNVIGLGAKGTMNRAVKALKATFETGVFPVLDSVRSTLGDLVDERLSHLKGRIMMEIERLQQEQKQQWQGLACSGRPSAGY